jgi:DNA-binding IscR family transcriptional regulator
MFNGPIAMLPCTSFNYYEKCEECKDEETCGLRSVMQKVRDVTLTILGQNTLEEIINKENELSSQKMLKV